jgi:hypothetical protein
VSKDVFNVLWKLLPHPPGSVVRLFSRDGDHRYGDFARSAAEMRKFARSQSGKNCYVAPNPTCSVKGLRHSAVDVTHWSYFLIDIDPVHEKVSDPLKAMDTALDWMSHWTGMDLRRTSETPPLIIDSGRGIQAWIRLEDWLLMDTLEKGIPHPQITRSMARRINGYWLKQLNEYLAMSNGCKVDTSVSDLPRIMRMPGTLNMKTKRTATILIPSEHVFTGLAWKLQSGCPIESLLDPAPPAGVKRGQKWQKVFTYMTRMAQDYLTRGQQEPGRHKVLWHTAKKLNELGVDIDEARRALRRANKLQGENEQLPLDQVESALAGAYEAQLKLDA